jgi:hypothetical protein
MEEKNQQERFLGVDREWGDDPEGRVKVEGFLGDGLSDCARYLSIRFLFTSSIMAAI